MIAIDAHVHIYPCHDLDTLVFSAFRNLFGGFAGRPDEPSAAVLFLTETAGNQYFKRLKDGKLQPDSRTQEKNWLPSNTDEPVSLRLTHVTYPGKELFLISGQQIVTSEKLEVLAIGCDCSEPDGLDLGETVRSIASGKGITILPWGVGKWLGRRGRIIDDFIAKNSSDLLFLGDNGSRPRFWAAPGLKPSKRANKNRLLSGTDPLPLLGEETRVGTFGSMVQTSIESRKPFASLSKALARPETEIIGYGKLQSLASFIKQQVALRMI